MSDLLYTLSPADQLAAAGLVYRRLTLVVDDEALVVEALPSPARAVAAALLCLALAAIPLLAATTSGYALGLRLLLAGVLASLGLVCLAGARARARLVLDRRRDRFEYRPRGRGAVTGALRRLRSPTLESQPGVEGPSYFLRFALLGDIPVLPVRDRLALERVRAAIVAFTHGAPRAAS